MHCLARIYMVCPLNTDPDHVMLQCNVRIGIEWARHGTYKLVII